jgi:hypothetical protein
MPKQESLWTANKTERPARGLEKKIIEVQKYFGHLY